MPEGPGSVAGAIKALQKKHGEDIAGRGLHLPQRPRIPAGILAFDIGTGGGAPINRFTLVYGMESSGKTLLTTCLIREFQRRFPEYKCVLVDVEGYDTEWAAKCGVDVEELSISRPDHAEMASDHVSTFLQAEDCGLVVLDSIAAMAREAELEKDADQVIVGGSSQIVNRMIRKATVFMRRAERQGRPTTFAAINQPRYKAGVVFGNPETLPGGMQQHFHAALRVRLTGKQRLVEAVAKDAPVLLDVNCTVNKNKQPLVTKKIEYTMALVGHDGLTPGQSNDFNPFKQYLSDLGLMEAVKGGWELVNPATGEAEKFKRQVDLWEAVRSDPARLDLYRQHILEELLP